MIVYLRWGRFGARNLLKSVAYLLSSVLFDHG